MDAKRQKLSYYQAIDPPTAKLDGVQLTQEEWDKVEWDEPDPVTLAYSSDGHVYRHIRPPAEPLNEEVSIGSGSYNVVYACTNPQLVYRVLKYPTSVNALYTADKENATLKTILDPSCPKGVRQFFPPVCTLYSACEFLVPNDKATKMVWMQEMTRMKPLENILNESNQNAYAARFVKKFEAAFSNGLRAPDLKLSQLCVVGAETATPDVMIADTGSCFVGKPTYRFPRLPCSFAFANGMSNLNSKTLVRGGFVPNNHPNWNQWVVYATAFAACCTVLQIASDDPLLTANFRFDMNRQYRKALLEKTLKETLLDEISEPMLRLLNAAFTDDIANWSKEHPGVLSSFVDLAL